MAVTIVIIDDLIHDRSIQGTTCISEHRVEMLLKFFFRLINIGFSKKIN